MKQFKEVKEKEVDGARYSSLAIEALEIVKNGTQLDEVKPEISEACANAPYMHFGYSVNRRSYAHEIIDKQIDAADFPQAKDIEPTVKEFADTMNILDNIIESEK